ncbi:hypothetical protein FOCG_15334 [Fusarium oxysporum f. sp. radicis-lycopersici 26381]|nr:hypothetical protein FOCG_15334 [Fusarium oxysporum f. sp. radicis-lycopersici 26381]
MDLGYLGRYLYLAWLHLHEGRPPFQGGGFFPKPFQIPKQTAESLDELSSFHRDLTHTLSVHLDDPVHFQQGRDHATIASQPVSPSIQSFKDHCYLIRPLFRVIYMVVDDQALAEYTKPLPVPERENEDWMALRSQARFSSFFSPINLLPLFDAGLALNVKRQDYQDQEKPMVVRVKLDDAIRFIYDRLIMELNCNKETADLAEKLRQEQDMYCQAWLDKILYPAVIFGSIAAGGIFTGANPSYTYSELVNQLTVSGAKCIVTDSPRLEMAKKAAAAAGLPPSSLVLINSKDSSAVGGVSSFQSLLGYGTYSWERISDPKVLADKPAVLNFSSGTTGLPKACEITHRNLVANAEQNLHLDRVARKRKNDSTFAANDVHCAFLPFYHAMGLITFCVLNVKRGCTTVVMPKFDLKSFLSTIQDFKVTYLILAPPVVSMLVKSPLICQYDLSSVKFLVCGAAPLQADVEKRLEALFSKTGARSRQGWGMSEATMSISIFGPDEFDPSHGSVGYLVANMQLQIIDENGKALGYDEEGEAILRGPNMFKGYYKNPAATKEAFTDDGWVKTGDIVKIDRTGLVTIVDRKKELIKVKGFQVAPSELEGHLLEHEGVLDCAVIRVLRDGQEHPQAHVVRKKPDATAESILSFMDKRLSPVKRITGGIVFTDAIPKSRSGKILRRLIKDGFASKDPSPRL